MIFYVEFTKKLSLFSLFTAWFFIQNKCHKCCGTFFEDGGGGNLLKQMYVEGEGGGGGTCKMDRNEQGREGGKKLEVSSKHTFWMTPS